MKKVIVVLGDPENKKHSVLFRFKSFEPGQSVPDDIAQGMQKGQGMSVYIPRPFAQSAKRVRLTLEEIE